jgi:hypothetical protein
MSHGSSLLKRPFFHTDDIFGSLVSQAHVHTQQTDKLTNKRAHTDITSHRKYSLGVTEIWQLLQITALPEDPFPKLNSNNSENEEHEKTKKQHVP